VSQKTRFRKNGSPCKFRVSAVMPRPGKDGALAACVRDSPVCVDSRMGHLIFGACCRAALSAKEKSQQL
jgi:hypothetical protein